MRPPASPFSILGRPATLALALLLASCGLAKEPTVSPPPMPPPDETSGAGGAPAQQPDSGAGGAGSPGTMVTIGNLDGGSSETPPAVNETAVVYAHSGSDLFSVDPMTLQIRRIGNFRLMQPGGGTSFLGNVTDIAVDARGKITGMTFNQLLDIDPATALCTGIGRLPAGVSFNGLTWMRTEAGAELLVGTGIDGRVFRIDPMTGMTTVLGQLGAGNQTSGDLVSVKSFGTLITLRGPTSDLLGRIDPATGAATVIGPTGFSKVWGLGFWGDKVFGFTQTGEFILIDPRTGAGSLVRKESAFPFWGAGVTTAVPVID